MSHEIEAAVKEHVMNMGIPASTGRDILDAATAVEKYLGNQLEIARITRETDEKEKAFKERKREISNLYYKKIEALRDEERDEQNTIDEQIIDLQAGTKNHLKPLQNQMSQVERIITLLRIAETIHPVKDIADEEVTTYRGEYLEWLGYFYKDDFLKIRLLITENRKPKNRYSLLAYGRIAIHEETLLRRLYEYGTPNLKHHQAGFSVLCELGSFPEISDAKAYAEKNSNKTLKQYIADFVKLKQEYLEVTANYKLSDFEWITAQDKKEGSK